MPHPRFPTEEIVRRGQLLYEQRIRHETEAGSKGKFLVVDIETGQYEIDASDLEAMQRARAANPDAALYVMRIGFPTAYRLGRSRGWIANEDIEQLTGDSLPEFEQRLPVYKALKAPRRRGAVQPQSKWAALASSYQEDPTMRGDSEEVNTLLREVREELTL